MKPTVATFSWLSVRAVGRQTTIAQSQCYTTVHSGSKAPPSVLQEKQVLFPAPQFTATTRLLSFSIKSLMLGIIDTLKHVINGILCLPDRFYSVDTPKELETDTQTKTSPWTFMAAYSQQHRRRKKTVVCELSK